MLWDFEMRTFILAAALVATPTAGTDRFDLICTTQSRHLPNADFRPSDPIRYRVDLAARRWCKGECSQTEQIFHANDNVVFMRSLLREGEMGPYERERVNRQTGDLSIISIGAGPLGHFFEIQGRCAPAEFSGFPDASRD